MYDWSCVQLGLELPNTLWFIIVDTLQYPAAHRTTATHCTALQHSAIHCDTLQLLNWETPDYVRSCNTLQHTTAHCNALLYTVPQQHTATHCNTTQHTAAHCSTLHHTATHCHTLQHTQKNCYTLQYATTYCTYEIQAVVPCARLTATQCNTLLHAGTQNATRKNILQHIKHRK